MFWGLIAGPAAFAQSPPAVPTGFSLQGHGTTAALAWTAVPGAATYNLYRSPSAGGEGATPYRTGLPGSATAYTDTGLQAQNYSFYQITAVGPGGESAKSAEISVLPIYTPAPVGVRPGNTQITVSWPGVGFSTACKIYRSTAPGGEGGTAYRTISPPYSTTFTDTGLTNGQTYYYQVTNLTATSESDRSAEVSSAPVPPPPLAPTNLNLGSGDAQMVLNWTASAGATGYNVYRAGISGTETGPPLKAVTGTSYTDAGLTNGVVYCYVVTAVNAGGESAWSNEVYFAATGRCAVPSGVRAVAASGQVAVSWNGVPGAYLCNVYRAGSAGGPFTLVDTAYTYYDDPSYGYVDTGLTNGQTYYYYVTSVAGYSNLESAPSATVSATPGAGPAAPSSLSARGVGPQINLSWPAVPGAVSYTVYRGTWFGSEAVQSLAAGLPGPSYTDTGAQLAPYSFYEVTAADANGTESARSPEAYAAALLPPPGLAAQAGNGQASLSWNLSPGNYRVYRGTASGAETAVTDLAQRAWLDAGLTNGQTYYYQVASTAYNSESARSGEISVTPGAALPAAVTGLSLSPGNNQVGLSWTASAGASSYQVYRSTASGGEGATAFQSGVTGAAFLDAAAANGTRYYYQVTAVNGSGESARCAEQSATPVGLPAAPSYLSATATSPSQIQLYWAPCTNAVGYALERSPDGAIGWAPVTSTAAAAFLDTGLTSGTPYFYRVKATDGTGDGPYSPTASATPGSSFFIVGHTPIWLTDLTFPKTVQVAWAAPAGFQPNVIYTWRRFTDSTRTASAAGDNTGFLTLTDPFEFVPGTPYYYGVTAYGNMLIPAAGSTPAASVQETVDLGSVTVTPLQPPTSDDQAVDSRLDPRYAVATNLNHNFGATAYRGGLYAGFIGDNSRVGRSFLKFPLAALPSGEGLWPDVGNLYLYYTRSYDASPTSVQAPVSSPNWLGSALNWGNAPAISASSTAETNVVPDPATPGPAWLRWHEYPGVLSGFQGPSSVAFGLLSTAESANGWAYFAKKEYKTGLAPFLLYGAGGYSVGTPTLDLQLNPASGVVGMYSSSNAAVTFNDASGANDANGMVVLNRLAPPGGLTVTLGITGFATLNTTQVTIPAGQFCAAFTVTQSVPMPHPVPTSGSYGFDLTVSAPGLTPITKHYTVSW